ncbi:MAG: DUF1553 domain-containing protein, partial [Verrucomicrobiota bacterium]
PAGLDELSEQFIASGHDLHHLIRTIAGSIAFQRSSHSGDPAVPVTFEQEQAFAAFPITPLRPEQVAGSIIQASSLQAIDHSSHFISKLRRFGETQEFVTRFGDPGLDTFQQETATIPQRLLLMNGKLMQERTEPNPLFNSSTRIARYSSSPELQVEAAFLATLARRPTPIESEHFTETLDAGSRNERDRRVADLFWTLMNTTEFSWNR